MKNVTFVIITVSTYFCSLWRRNNKCNTQTKSFNYQNRDVPASRHTETDHKCQMANVLKTCSCSSFVGTSYLDTCHILAKSNTNDIKRDTVKCPWGIPFLISYFLVYCMKHFQWLYLLWPILLESMLFLEEKKKKKRIDGKNQFFCSGPEWPLFKSTEFDMNYH